MAHNRLIWFQHLEKAAGTTVVKLAEKNGETFFPHHHLSIPKDAQDQFVLIATLTPEEQRAFVEKCFTLKVSFLSTVFGSPDFSILSSHPDIILFACFRDPLNRFVSSYKYEYYNGTIPAACTLTEYPKTGKPGFFTLLRLENYYCRMLSGDFFAEDITEAHFEKALSALHKLDYCFVIEHKDWLSRLGKALNWQSCDLRLNSSKPSCRRFLGYLKHGKLQLARRQLFHPRKADGDFIHYFKDNNKYDYLLYEAAQKRYQNLSDMKNT